MNAQNAKDYLPLVQALAEGKELQHRLKHRLNIDPKWSDIQDPNFSFPPENYRIKPEPRRWFISFGQERAIVFTSLARATMQAGSTEVSELVEVVEVLK